MYHKRFFISVVVMVLLFAVVPTYPLSAAPAASSNPFYSYDIIAQTGQANLVGISRNISINDSGKVALVGQLALGEGIFLGDGLADPKNINPSWASASRIFNDALQINNANLVVARDRISGSPPRTFIRTWDANAVDSNVVVARGGGTTDPFDSVLTGGSINNNGQVVFAALKGSSLLVTPGPAGTFNQIALQTPLRPLMADDGRIVVRTGSPGSSPTLLFANDLSSSGIIAGAAAGFTQLGEAPGISDDATVVVFAGDRGNGPGIFASIDDGTGVRTIVRVAGESWDGAKCRTAELGFDGLGNNLCFNAFDLNNPATIDNRVGVTRVELGPPGIDGDTLVVSFVSTPNAASRGNPIIPGRPLLFSNQRGLWTVRVDVEQELGAPIGRVYHPTGPIKVVQIGDVIGGRLINDFNVFDPIAKAATDLAGNPRTQRRGDHRIAFWAATAAGQVVVRASHLDSDEDGLLDSWETSGIDMDGDGVIDLDLKSMGADPLKRDIFLEIDWLNDRSDGVNPVHRNEPAPGVVQALVGMFAAAPALPNGIPAGVNLHVDAGPHRDALGTSFSQNMGGGPMEGGDKIGQVGDPSKHVDVVYFGRPGALAVPGVETRDFHGIKDSFFGTNDKRARELVFHYIILADYYSFINDAARNPFTAAVVAATANSLTSSLPFPTDAMGNPVMLAGHTVKITVGKGAGQIRVITANNANQLSVSPNWSVIPDATSSFALIGASSGRGEVYFYPGVDRNSVPGNDLIMTLGGFGINKGKWLANKCIQWRTLAHELGHTLGLRHGGTDHNPDKGANYLSLMSYSYQLMCGLPASPVQSYAGAGDPTYNDWANLKPDFPHAAIHTGNTFGRAFGSTVVPEEPEPELTVVDYERLNNAPVDLAGPVTAIVSPIQGSSVSIGSSVRVEITAVDDVSVIGVTVAFDTDGDGTTATTSETVTAVNTGPGRYEATLNNVSGPLGARAIQVLAEDPSGNVEIASRDVIVSTAPPPNLPPSVAAGGSYLVNEGAVVAVAASGTDPEGDLLTYDWDLDNDGTFETAEQNVTFSAVGLDGPSSQTIMARVTDNGGLSATSQATVNVQNAPPAAAFQASSPVSEGSAINLSLANPSDPSSADTSAGFAYAFDCGDGNGYGNFGSSSSASCPSTDNGSRTVKGMIRDKDGGEAEYSATVTISNVPPTATLHAPASVAEGSTTDVSLMNGADVSSTDTAAGFTYAFDCGSGYAAPSSATTAACATTDNGTRTVKGKVIDKDGGASEYTASVTINNVAPTVDITAPTDGALYALGAAVNLLASFTDPGNNDSHTCAITWDDQSATLGVVAPGACTDSHTFAAAGVYTIQATVTDDDGASSSDTVMVVVYDPSGGFVTGGGWIDSPAGAYIADPSLTGRANFGFVSKYQPGATTPTGETEFQFHVASFNFHSDKYQWLVVAGPKAQYKGTGSVNGVSGYGFLLTATDGQISGGGGVDKFRIKIWETATDNLVYDNVVGASNDIDAASPQAIGGGSIVIRKGK